MAVIEVRRVHSGRAGSEQARSRSYTANYIVRTDDRHDGPLTVFASLPAIGQTYETNSEVDLGARVTGRRADQVDIDPTLWRCQIDFESNQQESEEDSQNEAEPEDREPMYSVRFDRFEESVAGPFSTDSDGNQSTASPLMNSAGQPYNPPITREATRPVIALNVNERELNLSQVVAIQDVVNATEFAGFAAKTLKLNVTGAQEFFEENTRFWRKTYELTYRSGDWYSRPLDYGTITDEDGQVRETLLKNSSPTTGAPQYRGPYQIYREVDFATSTDIPDVIKRLGQAPR